MGHMAFLQLENDVRNTKFECHMFTTMSRFGVYILVYDNTPVFNSTIINTVTLHYSINNAISTGIKVQIYQG